MVDVGGRPGQLAVVQDPPAAAAVGRHCLGECALTLETEALALRAGPQIAGLGL